MSIFLHSPRENCLEVKTYLPKNFQIRTLPVSDPMLPADGCRLVAEAVAASGVAHASQNFAPGRFSVPQAGQGSGSGVAHSLQNFAPGRLSHPHCGHCMLKLFLRSHRTSRAPLGQGRGQPLLPMALPGLCDLSFGP